MARSTPPKRNRLQNLRAILYILKDLTTRTIVGAAICCLRFRKISELMPRTDVSDELLPIWDFKAVN